MVPCIRAVLICWFYFGTLGLPLGFPSSRVCEALSRVNKPGSHPLMGRAGGLCDGVDDGFLGRFAPLATFIPADLFFAKAYGSGELQPGHPAVPTSAADGPRQCAGGVGVSPGHSPSSSRDWSVTAQPPSDTFANRLT